VTHFDAFRLAEKRHFSFTLCTLHQLQCRDYFLRKCSHVSQLAIGGFELPNAPG